MREPTRSGRSPAPDRFEVLITGDGVAAINGERVAVAETADVHVPVLDALRRAAQAEGAPVEAVILARHQGYAALIEVAPDGSSRLLARM